MFSFLLVLASAAAFESLQHLDFEGFLAHHGKQYDAKEKTFRQALFDISKKTVEAHNEQYHVGKHSWYMALNQFADFTPAEFAQMRSAKRTKPSPFRVQALSKTAPNPATMDWRTENKVSPVKNQGSCGSCWAFSAIESVESHYAIAAGEMLELAPQTYVNCVENPDKCGGTGGCEGATMELAFNLTVTKGVALEADLPYKARDQTCSAYTPAVKATGYVKVAENSADALETALATVGPVSVTVAASSWQLYGGGVFSGCTSGFFGPDATLDHGVQAVGYTADYWIVRNSWGKFWGESGYIYVSRASDGETFTDKRPADGVACAPYPDSQIVGGECGILFDNSYPIGVTAA